MRAAIVLALLAVSAPAGAHGLRSAYIDVAEVEPGRALVHLRTATRGASLGVHVDGCALAASGEDTWLLACDGGLAGHALIVDGLGPIVSEAVVSVGTATHLVRAGDPRVELGATSHSAFREFIGLGLIHIITGYDHLLFLLLLVLLLRDVRSVLVAETAFTLSHSLSFTATALGWIHVSQAAAEVCIALSLVVLAADIELRASPPARWRGAAMAFAFGLVHGLGFAGGLREIGLPDDAIGSALVGFAGGIELGQVAFLALVLTALHLCRRVAVLPRLQHGALYAIGGLSAYWVLERATIALGWS
jgi:hypothetical protein